MKTIIAILASLPIFLSACTPTDDGSFRPVHIKSKVDAVQPATGLVLWSDNAEDRNATYGKSISLEYAYCLPCKVVTGKQGEIRLVVPRPRWIILVPVSACWKLLVTATE